MNHSSFGHARFCSEKENKMICDNPNHIEDALIFLTTEQNRKMILVTEDKGNIFTKEKRKNYSILSLSEFLELYSDEVNI